MFTLILRQIKIDVNKKSGKILKKTIDIIKRKRYHLYIKCKVVLQK